MTYLTKQNIKKETNEETASLLMSFLQRSTVSAVTKSARRPQYRHGKIVSAMALVKYYDVEKVIAYCNLNKHLSRADLCLSVCRSVQRV